VLEGGHAKEFRVATLDGAVDVCAFNCKAVHHSFFSNFVTVLLRVVSALKIALTHSLRGEHGHWLDLETRVGDERCPCSVTNDLEDILEFWRGVSLHHYQQSDQSRE